MPNTILVATAWLAFLSTRLGFAADSPVPAANRILIRGEQHLFCVSSEKSAQR
jgi:hypothetical protein